MYYFYSENKQNIDYTRNTFVSQYTQLVFSVHAPAYVAIALSHTPAVTSIDTYELRLGESNNQETVLRETLYDQELNRTSTPNILDPNSYKLVLTVTLKTFE